MKHQVPHPAALSHRWAHWEPSAFHWPLLLLFLCLLFATVQRGGRHKENEILTSCAPLKCFSSPSCPDLHHVWFFLCVLVREMLRDFSNSCSLIFEQLLLSVTQSPAPSWTLSHSQPGNWNYSISAQQTRTWSSCLKRKKTKKCTCKLKRMQLACFLMAPLPWVHCLASGSCAEQAVSAASTFLHFIQTLPLLGGALGVILRVMTGWGKI